MQSRSERPPEPPVAARAERPKVLSRDLFRDGNPILIEHLGEFYCLRMTRNNKLILTK